MKVCRTQAEMDAHAGAVLVPTMGALHAGHAGLIRVAAALAVSRGFAAGCVVTIFVNPTQFNDPADFARYPQTLDADLTLCEEAGAAAVLVPGVSEVYPRWPQTSDPGAAPPRLPRVAWQPGLEDAHRPGHFAGVCQVVKRLFELCRPWAAVFGEKDWQQLQVVRGLVVQEEMSIGIVAAATARDADGLALSSRNRFLTGADRVKALAIRRAILAAGREATVAEAQRVLRAVLSEAEIVPDYAVVRDAETLLPASEGAAAAYRTLVAARVGSVRLIDNGPWPGAAPRPGGA
ncbi:MAG: 4-phosphopantoate--beta-alanine ligase [Phycisphaerales bacterium]